VRIFRAAGRALLSEVTTAALALEALHKQVLPFLLRRLKEDVLNDLPPKIIQDYYCELSDVQKQLYDKFGNSQAGQTVEAEVQSTKADNGQKHVFQSLQYLRKLCNHPALVLKDDKAATAKAFSDAGISGKPNLSDIEHAPKLLALRFVSTSP
jgi:TATA-binding protein-associated factor